MFIIMIIVFVQHWFYLRLLYRHVDNVYVALLLTSDKFIWRKFFIYTNKKQYSLKYFRSLIDNLRNTSHC